MRRVLKVSSILCFLALVLPTMAAETTGRVFKVLPHLLDLKGRHTVSPSLYDRDAYQAILRENPDRVSGIRYDIQWKAKHTEGRPLRLRIELRSDVQGKMPERKTLETEVKAGTFSKWTSLSLSGDDYRKFGRATAWRVTLWDGEMQLAEQKSFLW